MRCVTSTKCRGITKKEMTNSALGVGESIHEEVTFDMDIVK